MRIGVLEAGAPPASLAPRFGSYGDMFARLLGDGFDTPRYDVQAGGTPQSAEACDGWLITGSSSGVYDGDAWIDDLAGFVRAAAGVRPMIGVCFGHQIMAQALGGEVIKSPKGWGVGLHHYEITHPAAWTDGTAIALPVSHQDQVVAPGERARVVGGSDFTPYGLLDYPDLRALSIQAHPEFAPDYATALIESRRGVRFDDATADAAVAALGEPNDGARVGGWFRDFFRNA